MQGGILILDKPQGWTSFDAVHKLRNLLHVKHVGHGGTLDPLATGVLPVFVEHATRAVELFEDAEKTYLAGIRFGLTTDTEDITGTVLTQQTPDVSRQALEQVLAELPGEQDQIPPMYSAIKVNGKRLYDLAREGRTVERRARHITVYAAELLRFDGQTADVLFRVSKGTYIRSLCRDIGSRLGCGACMASLRRTQAGVYTEKDCVTLEQIAQAEDPFSLLRPVETMFADEPELTVSSRHSWQIRNGLTVPCDMSLSGKYRVYSNTGEFLMLGRAEQGSLYAVKRFFEPQQNA